MVKEKFNFHLLLVFIDVIKIPNIDINIIFCAFQAITEYALPFSVRLLSSKNKSITNNMETPER